MPRKWTGKAPNSSASTGLHTPPGPGKKIPLWSEGEERRHRMGAAGWSIHSRGRPHSYHQSFCRSHRESFYLALHELPHDLGDGVIKTGSGFQNFSNFIHLRIWQEISLVWWTKTLLKRKYWIVYVHIIIEVLEAWPQWCYCFNFKPRIFSFKQPMILILKYEMALAKSFLYFVR